MTYITSWNNDFAAHLFPLYEFTNYPASPLPMLKLRNFQMSSLACSMTCSDNLPSTLVHTSGPNLALAHLPSASATMATSLKEFAFLLLLLLSCSTSSLDRLKAIGVTFSLVFKASIVILLSSRLVLNKILLLALLIFCNFVQNVGGLLIRALN